MKTILDQDVEDLPPYSPVKVTVFVLLLGMIAFAAWRFLRASAAVAQVAEASKDYRKLFPARVAEVPAPAPAPVATTAAPASGMAMLKIDDNMRAPKLTPPPAAPLPSEPPSAAPPESEPPKSAPPVAAAPVKAPALDSPKANRPAQKLFNQPRLNSGAFSGLNGGAGVSISGPGMGGGGGNAAPAAAPAMPVIPGLPAVPATDKK